jgi:hypothetical protein
MVAGRLCILNGGEAGQRDDRVPPPVGNGLLVIEQFFCYAWSTITLQLQDAQRELPVLADRALRGEEQ